MSDFITFASSAAVGSLSGLVLKELFDLWRSTRTHRHELQRRYFDAKLDATIRAIQQIKTASTTLRAILGVMRQNEDDNGWIDPALFTNVFEPTFEIMRRVNEQAAGVIALIGFYYDSGLAELVQQGTAPPTSLFQDISQFTEKAGRFAELQRLIDSSGVAPGVLQAMELEQAQIEGEIGQLINQMAAFADKLDQVADRIIGLMRDTYEGIRC